MGKQLHEEAHLDELVVYDRKTDPEIAELIEANYLHLVPDFGGSPGARVITVDDEFPAAVYLDLAALQRVREWIEAFERAADRVCGR